VALTLYRARFSTNVERVALALALKRLEAESVWIEYEDRSLVEQVSGQPLVPVLDYDGEILTESMDIVRELDNRHPDPPLYPADPTEVLAFVDWFNSAWKGPPNEIEAELGKNEPDRALIAELERRMIESLDRFEAMLASADYLFGDQLTAADVCAFPFLKFATLHDPEDDELFHLVLRDRQRDGRERPRLAAWIQRMDALPRA
jgi:maleylacetoacetate isomerase/maleylpyruvate isomerase